MTATLQAFAPIDASVRCDRCGAQAYVRVKLAANGLGLDFCAHHYKANEKALRDRWDAILDRRDLLK